MHRGCETYSESSTCFFFSSRRRHTRLQGDWSSDVCSSDLLTISVNDTFAYSQAGEQTQVNNLTGATLTVNAGSGTAIFNGVVFNNSGTFNEIGRASCRERV